MTRYIKREDAFKTLLEQCKITGYGGLTPADVKFAFSNIPSADVRENVRGHWIKLDMHRGMEQYKCSSCGESCYVPECMGEPMYLFCPGCGALMQEDEP